MSGVEPTALREGKWRHRFVALSVLVAATLLPDLSAGQSGRPDSVGRIIEQARESGVSIIVLDGDAAAAARPAEQAASLSERTLHLAHTVSTNLHRTLADLAAAPETLPAVVAEAAPHGGTAWPGWTALAVVLSLLAGWAVERGLARLIAPEAPSSPPAQAARGERLRATLLTAAAEGFRIAIGLAVALLLAVSIAGNEPHHRTVIIAAFEAVACVRLLLVAARAILDANSAEGQAAGMSREAATEAYVMLRNGLWLAGLVAALTLWLSRIGAEDGLVTVAAVLVSLVTAMALTRTARFLRRSGLGGADGRGGDAGWLRRNWHLIVTGYFVAAIAVTVIGRLAGLDTSGIVIAPVVAAILASLIYALALLAVDAAFGSPKGSADAHAPSYRGWAERSARTIALVMALCTVLGAWGVDFIRDDGSVRPLYSVLLVTVLAHIGWSAIRTAFDRKIAEERAAAGPELEDGDEGGAGGTRLATLLPLFRNAVLIAIVVLVFMVVLSAIGIDIAPLFAGAGLVGIAIGFGAQTLVRDIFSGIFYLIDDAFRVGEYIETGSAKGAVEKISIRSMQLRHHNGPLHTIPFGEITQLTNFSRDWVIMKLPIRVRFGTDTERVRKLIKKLGQELLEHPVIGQKFVESLKSQGVYQMDELGIVTRVKFKTKPGDQFAVRKVVYQKIAELFEREGIAFGGREVVVRAVSEGKAADLDRTSADVAAAAADTAGSGPPRSA